MLRGGASLTIPRLERERLRQDAVPPSGIGMSVTRSIPVLEHVSKMCIALTAKDFRSFHAVGDVRTRRD